MNLSEIELGGVRVLRQRGREIELVVNGNADEVSTDRGQGSAGHRGSAARDRTIKRDPVSLMPPAGLMSLVLLFVVLLLRFALTNHRSSDRTPSRIWRHLLWLSGSMAAGFAMLVLAFGSRL